MGRCIGRGSASCGICEGHRWTGEGGVCNWATRGKGGSCGKGMGGPCPETPIIFLIIFNCPVLLYVVLSVFFTADVATMYFVESHFF